MRRWRKRQRTRFRSIGLAIPTETGTAEVASNSVLWQTRRSAWRYLSEPCTALYLILPYSTSSGEPVHISWHNHAGLALATASTPAEELLQPLRNALFSSTELHLHTPIPERVTQW